MTIDQNIPAATIEIERLIGKVLWELQAFEETLARLIALVNKIPMTASLDEARMILEDLRGGTLGRLIKQTKQVVPFGEDFDIFITKFLQQRNWLVHRSHITHKRYIEDQQIFVDLKYRIKRLSMDSVEFNSFFKGVITEWLTDKGITVDELEALAEPDDDYADKA